MLTLCLSHSEAGEEVIADKTGVRDWRTGIASGGITGGFYAGIVGVYCVPLYHLAAALCSDGMCASGGRLRGLQGAAAGAALGAASVIGREQFTKWRMSKALERYEEKYGTAPAVYYPNTDILVETKGPVRDLEFPSLLPKSVKISDEEIERRVQVRLEELRQKAAEGKTDDKN